MDLPHLADEAEALPNWTAMIRKLQAFLEKTFNRRATDPQIENALQDSNRKNRMVREIFAFAARKPPVLSWREIYDIGFFALLASGEEAAPILETAHRRLEQRVAQGYCVGDRAAPRVMVTGCPVGGDATKIFTITEEAGGVIVAPDACTGLKGFYGDFDENSADPVAAIAKRYLNIPCACMTPNQARLNGISQIIYQFQPDLVIDLILQACHTYNVESYKVGNHVRDAHHLPFLKIESDYSDADTGQIKTRVEAMLEMARGGQSLPTRP